MGLFVESHMRIAEEGSWGLFFFHPSAEPFEAFLGGLFDEGHVLGEMLLRVDFAFLSPFQLGQSEL